MYDTHDSSSSASTEDCPSRADHNYAALRHDIDDGGCADGLAGQVSSQRMVLEIMTGKTSQLHTALKDIRDGLLCEVVELRRNEELFFKAKAPSFFEKHFTTTHGKNRSDALMDMQANLDEIADVLKDQNALLLRLVEGVSVKEPKRAARPAAKDPHKAQKERIKEEVQRSIAKREAAKAATQVVPLKHLTVEQLIGVNQSLEEKHRLQQQLLQDELEVLRQKLSRLSKEETRDQLQKTKQHFLELREGVFFVKHSLHVYRKWLRQNQVFGLIDEAVMRQSNTVQGLSLMLPLLSSVLHTTHRFVSSALRHPGNVQVMNEVNEWWSADVHHLPDDWLQGMPFRLDNKGHFESEAVIMQKHYKLITHLLSSIKHSRDVCTKQADELEKLKTQVKELLAEKEFMEQQQNMLKMTIEEMANDKRGRRHRRGKDKDGKRLSKSRSLKSRRGLSMKRSLRRSGSNRSQKSFKYRSLSRSSAPTSTSSSFMSRSCRSFSSYSPLHKGRAKKGKRHRNDSSSSSKSSKSSSKRSKEDDEDDGRGKKSAQEESVAEEEDDSMSEGEAETVFMFNSVLRARVAGRYFLRWLRCHYKRVGEAKIQKALNATLESAAQGSSRGRQLGCISRTKKRDEIHKMMERVQHVAFPVHMTRPPATVRERGRRPFTSRCAPQQSPGGAFHGHMAPPMHMQPYPMPHPPDCPDMHWIQAWRTAVE